MKRRIAILAGLVLVSATACALAQGPGGKRGSDQRRPGGSPGVSETRTTPKDDVEKKLLAAIEDITQKQGWKPNVPVQDGRMLRLLAESSGAKTVVEVGTSSGISTIWLAMGLRRTGGKVITHEINPDTVKTAQENFKTAGVADMITIVEGDAHDKLLELKGPIDMVFIDADKDGYADYLKKLLPLVRSGGLICAHNIDKLQGNPEFVKGITTNPELETVLYTTGAGMSVSLKKR